MFWFTDEDNDGKADKKELLFKVAGGEHDHSAHASVFGPDGRLYWNFGNEGGQVFDAAGKPILERDGRPDLARFSAGCLMVSRRSKCRPRLEVCQPELQRRLLFLHDQFNGCRLA